MQVNIVGPMVCAKHAVRAMSTARGGKGGSIVTIASGAARAPAGLPGIVPYAAAKGALVTFARGLSNELPPRESALTASLRGSSLLTWHFRRRRKRPSIARSAGWASRRRSRRPCRG